MKRFKSLFLALILALAIVVGLTACNPTGAPTKTLTFEMNGHGVQVQAQKLKKEQFPERPEDPSEEGWIFKGWYIDEDFTDYFYFDPIYEDTTVYAKWIQAFTVSFNTGATGTVIPTQSIEAGDNVDLPANPTAPGKKFEGWYTDPAYASAFNANTPITGNVTLYAKWSPYYKVTFDKNGKGNQTRVPAPQEYLVDGCKAVQPEDMSANYFKFGGWSTTSDGSSGIYDFDTVLTDSITLYAQWIRLYKVSFDLNNVDALQLPPEEQEVEEGKNAVRPEIDPVLSGWIFDGWFTKAEGGEEFNFENTAIKSTITIYAHWTKNQVATLDVVTPEYSYREEAAYGERPDLDGYVIDGKMGEAENWEDQNWYITGITEAPSAFYKVTTQMSEKGLYVFISVEDNGGLYHDGRNYYFKNSHLEFRIDDYGGPYRNNWFRIDTETLYPSSQRVKIAVNIAEGEVNTPNADNKRAVMNVELFATWKDLQFFKVPETVGIYTMYKYKRLAADNIKYTLAAPFDDTAVLSDLEYVAFNKDGYRDVDAENAILGASSYNIAKTYGWDITHESDETNAYVSSNGSATQAIFYKGITNTEYYDFEFEIDGSHFVNSGKAGATIYSSSINYAMLLFNVNNNTYNRATGKFVTAQPCIRVTDKDGKLVTKNLNAVDVSNVGRIQVRVIFSNGYIYCILNDVLIHCEFVSSLNVRTNPGLVTTDGGEGVRFINYTAKTMTASEAKAETAKYAYAITVGRLARLTMELSTTGVSSKEGVSKQVTMSLTNSQVLLTNSQKEEIINEGTISKNILVSQIETLTFAVNGVAEDFTDELTDPETGAKWGEFVFDYPFKGDSVITNTTSFVPTEELTAIVGRIVDSITGKAVAATATITSNNPRLGRYDIGITAGDVVLVVPKGYDYKIEFNQTAYRTTKLDIIEDIDGVYRIEETIKLVPNVLGGTAMSKRSNFSQSSSIAGWDMSEESNGLIIFETTKANPPPVFFSGYTIHNYQYAKVSVSNVTDITAFTQYEKDPAIGFRLIPSKGNAAFIGLRQKGLRYLDGLGGWNPVQIDGFNGVNYGKETASYIDPTGEHKDTLEILRIDRLLYAWVNDFYMGCITLPEAFVNEVAIAVNGTFSYYGKIIYRDYEIKVGDEAVEIAKERVGLSIGLSESAYQTNYDTWEPDLTKPLVKVEGMTEIRKDDNSIEEVALAGNVVKVTRTEFASPTELYTVSVGSYASVILSEQNPTASIALPQGAKGNVEISVSSEASSTITGKYANDEITLEKPLVGQLVFSTGLTIDFTTGLDGTYAISVPTSSTFTIKLKTEGFVASEITTKTPSTPGASKKLEDIAFYTTQFGGVVAGTSYKTELPYGQFYASYDISPETPYEGEYIEVEATFQNQYIAINTGTFNNFDISFSLIRYQYTDRPNESDPAFGIQVINSTGNDQILFHKDGVRSFPKGNGTVLQHGIMKYNTANSYGVKVDFRIIRRNSLYLMYYKLESDEDWILIKTLESQLTGAGAVRFMSCTSKALRYVLWNFSAKPINNSYIPDEVVSTINVNVSSGDNTGIATLGGGTEIADEVKYLYGDVATVTMRPNSGYVSAYAKVNGEFVTITANKFSFVVDKNSIDVEVVFEPMFETHVVTGKIAVDNTYKDYDLPSAVTVVAYMEDGRSYTNNNVPVGADGSVSIQLREGTFKIYAYSSNLASKEKSVTINSINKNFGTITLCTMVDGNVTVNGTTLETQNAMGKTLLYSDGMLNLPVAQASNCWLPEAVTAKDFVFSADIIQTGTISSPYFSNDEVCGFIFSNGTKTFSIQFWGDGFRISESGFSSKAMLFPNVNGGVAYFGSMASGVVKQHNLAVKVVGTDMHVYVNYKHTFSMTSKDGFVWASGVNGTLNKDFGTNNMEVVKGLYNGVVGDGSKEIAIGLHCNLKESGKTYTNQAGFFNVKFTDKENLVKAFNGKF